jgi:putative intracellular protease/amidase
VRTVLFAILPEVVLLDVAGAADAFRIAEREAPGNYQLRFVSTQSTVRAAVGLHLDKLEPLPQHIPDHSVIVVTGVTSKGLRLDSAPAITLVRWLKRAMENETVTLMCVCAGALLAAKAGVLKGRECTTHHQHIDDLMQMEPAATVHANRIFVEDGRVFTSAGVTAGLDLTLYVIGQQLGHQVVAAVARDRVHAPFGRRSAALAMGHASQPPQSSAASGSGCGDPGSGRELVSRASRRRCVHERPQSRATVRGTCGLLAARLCPATARGVGARVGVEQRAGNGARSGEDWIQLGASAAASLAQMGGDAADGTSSPSVRLSCCAGMGDPASAGCAGVADPQ